MPCHPCRSPVDSPSFAKLHRRLVWHLRQLKRQIWGIQRRTNISRRFRKHVRKECSTCSAWWGPLHMGQLTSRNWKLSRRPVSSNATNYCDCHKNTRPMHQQFLSFRTTQWLLYNTFIGKQATNWQQWSASFAESLGMALISWNWSCRSFIWFLTWQVAQMWQHFVPEVRIKS